MLFASSGWKSPFSWSLPPTETTFPIRARSRSIDNDAEKWSYVRSRMPRMSPEDFTMSDDERCSSINVQLAFDKTDIVEMFMVQDNQLYLWTIAVSTALNTSLNVGTRLRVNHVFPLCVSFLMEADRMSSTVFYESLINLINPLRANVTLSQNFIYNLFFTIYYVIEFCFLTLQLRTKIPNVRLIFFLRYFLHLDFIILWNLKKFMCF